MYLHRERSPPMLWLMNYTLSHPENDRDVTERAQGYTLQDASFYASIPVFLFERVRKHTSCARDDKRLPLNTR